MNTVEIEGFLSEEAQKGITHIVKKFENAFNLAKRLNQFAMNILKSLNVDWKDEYNVSTNSIILRITENYQAAIILLERGMIVPSKNVTRSNLESVFILCALQLNPELFDNYKTNNIYWQKNCLLGAINSQNKYIQQMVIKNKLNKEYNEKKKECKNSEFARLSAYDWAKKANLNDLYNIYYNMYSGSMHSNFSLIYEYVDEDKNRRDMAFGPNVNDLYGVIRCNIYIMIFSIHSISLINQKDFAHRLNGFHEEINELDKEYLAES